MPASLKWSGDGMFWLFTDSNILLIENSDPHHAAFANFKDFQGNEILCNWHREGLLPHLGIEKAFAMPTELQGALRRLTLQIK